MAQLMIRQIERYSRMLKGNAPEAMLKNEERLFMQRFNMPIQEVYSRLCNC